MKRWLVAVSLLGAAVVWARRTWLELTKPLEEFQAGLAPDWDPWWTMSRALEEEGLLPPPV